MGVRAGVTVAVAVVAIGVGVGFADNQTPSVDVGRSNPAQPVARVEPIRQGDRCSVNGATAVNEKGEAFDCEPGLLDGVLRWIYP